MAFKEIFLMRRDALPEDFKYLINIGYVDMLGCAMTENPCTYYRDDERNAYLIGLSANNINFHGDKDTAYVLCINGKPVGIRVDALPAGKKNKMYWRIKDIRYPEDWNVEDNKNFKQIMIDAFTADTKMFFSVVEDKEIVFEYEMTID